MKKILALLLSLMIVSAMTVTAVFAETDTAEKESSSSWMPHNYVLSGYNIPTAMECGNDGSVTFHGSLNAGIATTGFNYLKPIDLNDFSIDMSLNIPSIENLTWISFTLLNTNLMTDAENSVAPVAMPFNAMSGMGGYNNAEQNGMVVNLWTQDLVSQNILGISANSKNIDLVDSGEENGQMYMGITEGNFLNGIVLENGYANDTLNLKISVKADENDGLAFNINDGRWSVVPSEESTEEENAETPSVINPGNNLKGMKQYFENNDCYFALVMMYKDDTHREVALKVNSINGKAACDGTVPSYTQSKTVQKDGITLTVGRDALDAFGVYPSAVDGINVTDYDEDGADYDTVIQRGKSLGMEVVKYFKVAPSVGGRTVRLKDFVSMSMNLPEGYSEFKFYFINDDEEAQVLGSSFAKTENGVATLRFDNETITKIIVYGKKTGGGTSDSSGSSSGADENKGCGGLVGTSSAVLAVIAMAIPYALVKRKENN